MMQDILGEMNTTICLVYLDNLLVFTQMWTELLEQLEKVLGQLAE
jgi:hypothetical protein